MAPTKSLILLCVLLVGSVLNSVTALGYSSQSQGQDQGQGQTHGGGNFGSGRESGVGQQGGFGGGAEESRSGAEGRNYGGSQYGGQPGGEDASKYNFRIYTEPEYYGYESKFPGGKAMFKSYRSADSGFGRQGAEEEYNAGGRSGKSYDNFGSQGGQRTQY